MSPLPVIADVYRIALNWTTSIPGGGRNATNVLHVRSTGDVDHVGTTMATLLEAAAVADNPFALLDGDYVLISLNVIPLDGTSVGVDYPVESTNGGGTGDSIPNMANCVAFHTARRGPRGRGRIFIGPIAESEQEDGLMNSTATAIAVAENWVTLHAAMRAADPSIDPVVASYAHADANSITSVRCNFKLASQRRRLDRIR